MLTIYTRTSEGVQVFSWSPETGFPTEFLWADLHNATPEEEQELQLVTGITLPSQEEEWKNEVMGRMVQSDNVSYMTASAITKNDGPYPETHPITFILTESFLITQREIAAPTSFHKFAKKLTDTKRDYNSGPEVLEGLLQEMVIRVAYNSELVVAELDDLSHSIFDPYGMRESEENTTDSLQVSLQRLGAAADLNGKIHESLHSIARMTAFFKDEQSDNHYLTRKLETLSTDIKEIFKQTEFLSAKINFQLDATLGMINVEQNVIMKILSIFTVVIMPPTLIAGIYGMNFKDMPELSHTWGYPIALVLMLACASGPYLYFRHKRWL